MVFHMAACDPLPMAKKSAVRRIGHRGQRAAAVRRERRERQPAINDRRSYGPLRSFPLWFKLAGVRARQVADAIDENESHLSNIINGRRDYMRHHLEGIAVFLSEKIGRRITPAMLLHPPADPDLAVLAAQVDPALKDRAAHALEAFRKSGD